MEIPSSHQIERFRAELVEVARRMYDRRLLMGCEGNLSTRIGPGHLLITPHEVCKGDLLAEQLVLLDLDGAVVGDGTPTSEFLVHLEAYRRRPGVSAVAHAHPPYATAFAAASRTIDTRRLPEVAQSFGTVPLCRFAAPGSSALAQGVGELLPDHHTILLEKHGALTVGASLRQAFLRMETLEHLAHIALLAEVAAST